MSEQALTPVLSLVVSGAKAVVRWYQARRDFAALCSLDDRSLADIGLKRSDLRNASSVGVHEDPTLILVSTVKDRQRYQPNMGLPYVHAPAAMPEISSVLTPAMACR